MKISDTSLDGKVKCHFVERDEDESYLQLIRDKTLNVYDLENAEQKTITYDEGCLDYLSTDDPENNFHSLTVDDTSWLTNREVTVEAAGEIEEEPRAGIVYIKRGLKTTCYSMHFHVPDKDITVNYTSVTQTAGTSAEYSSITIATAIRDLIVNANQEEAPNLYEVHEHFHVDLFGRHSEV